jgi:uncharacterized HAD superfamily protein
MAKVKRIGLDLDGVLCNFTKAFIAKANELYPNSVSWDWVPQSWNHEESGLSAEQISRLWYEIKRDHDFWMCIEPLPGAAELDHHIHQVMKKADIYFITAREGVNVRAQTDKWLTMYIPNAPAAHHLILVDSAYHKIEMMHAMDIKALLDDKGAFVAVAKDLPQANVWLMRRPWNEHERRSYHLRSVESVTEYLEKEGLI